MWVTRLEIKKRKQTNKAIADHATANRNRQPVFPVVYQTRNNTVNNKPDYFKRRAAYRPQIK